MEENDKELRNFCLALPKIELHAHLNGSLSAQTIHNIKLKKHGSNFQYGDGLVDQLDMPKCFDLFQEIHQLMDSLDAISYATDQVIKDYALDGTRYLEIRTTPKIFQNCSKSDYVDAVIKSIEGNKDDRIVVRLLLSVDRKDLSLESAQETATMACHLAASNTVVAGVDFSGYPHMGDARKFIPIMQFLKREGIKIATHLAEIPDQDDETVEILQSAPPDRIGHGTFIHSSFGGRLEGQRLTESLRIPLELCLTSNVHTRYIKSYKEHHFPTWFRANHPCCICTDDKGIFETTLSNEYYLAAKNFNLSKKEIYQLSENSIDYIFADQNVKNDLRCIWNKFKKENNL